MVARITIGIPTCGRPQAIKNCLESIQQHIHFEHQIIIVDSLATEESLALYASFAHTECISFTTPIGPAAARKLIAERAEADYVLFLDDDNEVTAGCVERLIEYLETHPEIDIVGGAWREEGSLQKRAIGQQFNFGFQAGQKVIFKSFVTVDQIHQLGLESFKVNVVLATMLVRKPVFERVNFDPRYDFFYELFDFFLQCYDKGVNVFALPSAIFEHKPLKYTQSTLRENNKGEREKQKFIEKWGLIPTGSLDLKPPQTQDPVNRLVRRTKKMLKQFV